MQVEKSVSAKVGEGAAGRKELRGIFKELPETNKLGRENEGGKNTGRQVEAGRVQSTLDFIVVQCKLDGKCRVEEGKVP